MARKAKAAPAGAPAWMVTFADLMSLLVCFFVLIISFSIMDDQKLQVVAGSLKDAFGIQKEKSVTGIVEIFGNPFFDYQKLLSPTQIPLITMAEPNESKEDNNSDFDDEAALKPLEEGPEQGTNNEAESEEELAQQMAEQHNLDQAEQNLRDELEKNSEFRELADNVELEQTPLGLRIDLLDQEDEPMFAVGSYRLLERPKRLLQLIAEAVARLPNRLSISGHTDGLPFRSSNGYNNWNLSADRANATRRSMVGFGLPETQIDSVIGRADAQPLFPEDPYDPRNRRISIVILRQFPATPQAAEAPLPAQ